MRLSKPSLSAIDRDLYARSDDVRWQAAIALGNFAESNPEYIWPLVVKHGSRRHADVRMAIATCVLEHILEHHFNSFFPRVETWARQNRWFHETFQSCWQFGQSALPRNNKRWRALAASSPVDSLKPRTFKPSRGRVARRGKLKVWTGRVPGIPLERAVALARRYTR